jgi:hypothetical protein
MKELNLGTEAAARARSLAEAALRDCGPATTLWFELDGSKIIVPESQIGCLTAAEQLLLQERSLV